ncbi:MAG: hypothetical protein J5641_05490 [Bacteroidales bacterium]|nr:hypothetical protein [Bacteroidales bacterium]
MKTLNEKKYLTPSIKVVEFKVELGLTISQPEEKGATEKMNYSDDNESTGENLGWNWDRL